MSFLPIVKPKDVIRVALRLGFVFDRQSGSHAIYYREKDKKRILFEIENLLERKKHKNYDKVSHLYKTSFC